MPQITPPKKLKQSRVQCTVTFTVDEVRTAEETVLRTLSTSVKIEGFRPGKAPLDMVRSQVSAETLTEEAIRAMLPPVFRTLTEEHQVRPIIPPAVELRSRDPFLIALTFVEQPEVKVKGAQAIRIPKKEITVGPEDVERMMGYIVEQYRTVRRVDREAKTGDQVTIDFTGTHDGVEAEGTSARGYGLRIGGNTLIPGFEEQLIGMKAGDRKQFSITFPGDYRAEHLRGKPVEFSVAVTAVEEVQLPTIDDAFVQSHALGESLEELQKQIERTLRLEEERRQRSQREGELFDALHKATVVDLAPELITQEERVMLNELHRDLEQRKLAFDQWLRQTGKTMEQLQGEMRAGAQRRLQLRFGIQKVMADQDIAVSPDEIARAVTALIADVPEAERKAAQEHFREGDDGYEELRWRLRVEKWVEKMLSE